MVNAFKLLETLLQPGLILVCQQRLFSTHRFVGAQEWEDAVKPPLLLEGFLVATPG